MGLLQIKQQPQKTMHISTSYGYRGDYCRLYAFYRRCSVFCNSSNWLIHWKLTVCLTVPVILNEQSESKDMRTRIIIADKFVRRFLHALRLVEMTKFWIVILFGRRLPRLFESCYDMFFPCGAITDLIDIS